jgi:hypothetical protein
MNTPLFDATPLWLVFVLHGCCAFAEAGFRAGIYRTRKSEHERQAPIDPLVGSTLGLLAFMLAFTFGMATSRYDARKQFVLDDVIAIRTADLRAQLLPEPHRGESRALLREYVDVRVLGASTPAKLPQAIVRSEELQDQLWARAMSLLRRPCSVPAGANPDDRRARGDGGRSAEPHSGTIWICCLLYGSALDGRSLGIARELSGKRSMVARLTMVLAFSAVILLTRPISIAAGRLRQGQPARR